MSNLIYFWILFHCLENKREKFIMINSVVASPSFLTVDTGHGRSVINCNRILDVKPYEGSDANKWKSTIRYGGDGDASPLHGFSKFSVDELAKRLGSKDLTGAKIDLIA